MSGVVEEDAPVSEFPEPHVDKLGALFLFTSARERSKMHCGKKAIQQRQRDALCNVQTANPVSWHSCGCSIDMFHQPKHCCFTSTVNADGRGFLSSIGVVFSLKQKLQPVGIFCLFNQGKSQASCCLAYAWVS